MEAELRRLLGREAGVVLSGASAIMAPVALSHAFASRAREEMMMAVYDERLVEAVGGPAVLLGVLRFVTRYEPFLKRGLPNLYVYEPRALDSDLLSPFSNAYVEIYGVANLVEGRLEPPVYAPHPGSRVYLVEGPELLERVAGGRGIRVGRHPFTGWEPSIPPDALRMHVGIFGATGMGKSRLTRRLVREASKHYSIIVFDHSGVDYAPVAARLGSVDGVPVEVVDGSRIRLDVVTMTEVLVELMDVPGSLEDYVFAAVYCHEGLVRGEYRSVQECIAGQQGRATRSAPLVGQKRVWSLEDFEKTLDEVAAKLNAKQQTRLKLRLYARRVPRYIYEGFGRRDIEPRELVEKLVSGRRIIVVDLGGEEEIVAKRAIIARVVDEVWSLVHEKREPVNIGVVVDEAQHYACEHCRPSAQRLEKIAREGRKWGFWLLVASQRFTRDIRPGVRANLGTIFFSKLQATGDLNELAGYLDLGNLSQANLAMLDRRQFYLAGLGNPLRKPVLVEVSHVPEDSM